MIEILKSWAKSLKQQIKALYFASKSQQVPWWLKLVIVMIVAYALSPIDLIPDFIPVLGYLDDLLLLPLAIYAVIKLMPKEVWQSCLKQAEQPITLPKNHKAAVVIVIVWMLLLGWLIVWLSYHP